MYVPNYRLVFEMILHIQTGGASAHQLAYMLLWSNDEVTGCKL